ncbi:MAG: uroporphyrinogen decarboxylase [Deltaproteobacteria bacterium]|nr:uroporphyrinogen decarboxylase [Deltaproteobacteria bacterium]
MLKNDTFLKACRREKTDYTPVWMMRQAGRYLPEYMATRGKAGDFLTLCKTPELAAEVTIQPIDILGVDAAILFSDILVIPEAMGMELQFLVGEGPHFPDPVRTSAAIDKLVIPDPMDKLGYVMKAITAINKGLDGRVPLIGFTGAPWTLATYMVEGGGSKNFALIKKMLYDTPELMHKLLDKTTDAVVTYLNAQIETGVHAVQIFDTWGGILTPDDFEVFSLQYIERIVSEVKGKVPVIVFAKGAGHMMESIAGTGCDVVGVDWMSDIGDVRKRIGDKVALQGNMDPCTLYASPERIRKTVEKILAGFGEGKGHIFNLGHGILPDIPVDHAKAFINAVHELSPAYHRG